MNRCVTLRTLLCTSQGGGETDTSEEQNLVFSGPQCEKNSSRFKFTPRLNPRRRIYTHGGYHQGGLDNIWLRAVGYQKTRERYAQSPMGRIPSRMFRETPGIIKAPFRKKRVGNLSSSKKGAATDKLLGGPDRVNSQPKG